MANLKTFLDEKVMPSLKSSGIKRFKVLPKIIPITIAIVKEFKLNFVQNPNFESIRAPMANIAQKIIPFIGEGFLLCENSGKFSLKLICCFSSTNVGIEKYYHKHIF